MTAARVAGDAVAVVVARGGRLPPGTADAVAEAGGPVVVVGSGAEDAAGGVPGATSVWWSETGDALRPGALGAALAPVLAGTTLVVLSDGPDGRDLAPRLAAEAGRPLLARCVRAGVVVDPSTGATGVAAVLARLDDRVEVPVTVAGPAVATLVAERRAGPAGPRDPRIAGLGDLGLDAGRPEAETVGLLPPDLRTMDLADATRVLGGGAGLVAGADDATATAAFTLLGDVAAALGASAGATRVATDAGWTAYDRQIGTTGVTVDPDLYVALGVSGAAQHVGGIGAPRHVVSVNTDPSCPMTAMADLGLVTDAGALLVALARRLGVPVPAALEGGTARG